MTASALLRRTLLFLLLWVVLVEGDPRYFGYALLAVPVAVTASLVWLPAGPPSQGRSGRRTVSRVLSAVLLLGWLVGQSVRGGIDVARRSLSRPVKVDPVEVVVPVHLTGGSRAVALAVVGLLPGTIVDEVRDDEAVVHTLSSDFDVAGTWRELERRVGDVIAAP